MTLLFTDIKDSAALYQRVGDAKAFEIVTRHFEILTAAVKKYRGFVVKTIGDSIMASFYSPEDALLAALEMQTEVLASNTVSIKVAAHCGPCFVVNRNDRLDYFGTTVNLAARALGFCESDEILITGKMIDDPLVKDVLSQVGRSAIQTVRELKGFEGEFELYRIQPIPKS